MPHPPVPRHVVLNGNLLEAGGAKISPLGEGFLFGRGLFETIKVLRGRPVFFPEHFDRLRRGAGELGLPFTTSVAELRARCDRIISANQLAGGSLKVVVFQDPDNQAGELILTREHAYPPGLHERGFRLKTIPDGRREGCLSGLKTLNQLKNLQARQVAREAGCDEALFVGSDGLILEGAVSNVFAVRGGEVLTPRLDTGILPGIVRGCVLRLWPGAREEALTVSQLIGADEVFVTNSLIGVMPVACIDRQGYDVNRNPVTQAIAKACQDLESRS